MSVFILLQRKEREMQQKLDQKEETALELQETYASLQQEVEVKTKKLKKVINYSLNFDFNFVPPFITFHQPNSLSSTLLFMSQK